MEELADVMRVRDQAMEAYDLTQSDEDLRVYEAAEERLNGWFDVDAPAKLAALISLRDKRKADAAWRRSEAERWRRAAKSADHSSEWLEQRAIMLLRRAEAATGEGLSLPGGRRASVKTRRSARVSVTNREALPVDCVRVKVEVDKQEIKKRLKSGTTVEGAELVEMVKDYVSIRS
tara:strand:+ start:4112 stop:4639 length:528 start_codon:yes stop_codon:yes gene_type:complete